MNNFDWNAIRAFLCVVEHGSLSGAARELDVSQPTLGRQISRLEQQLELRLFDRRQTGFELTDQGKRLVAEAQSLARSASNFRRSVELEKTAAPLQVCTITLGEWGLHFLSGRTDELLADLTGLRIELFADDAFWDLSRNAADIAIGNRQPSHSHLIAQKLGNRNFFVYASDRYLRMHPEARNPGTWATQSWAGYCGARARLKSAQVLKHILNGIDCRFSVNSSVALLNLLKSGEAMGVLPDWIGEHEGLVRLSNEPLSQNTSWLSFHERLRLHPQLSELKRRLVGMFRSRYELTDAGLKTL
ncbi:LysR family transcriptional regulator [Roseibium sp. HPY-6]|uniref:LysR family transcriptional regulator n=1 Tax=Roseibium sp. HPY-6 TaxID=3229852 RepID=UPI00338DD339